MYYHQQPPYYPASGPDSGATTPKEEDEDPEPQCARPATAPSAQLSRLPSTAVLTPSPPQDIPRRARSAGPKLIRGLRDRAVEKRRWSRAPSEVTCSSHTSLSSPASSDDVFHLYSPSGAGPGYASQVLGDRQLPPGYSWNPSMECQYCDPNLYQEGSYCPEERALHSHSTRSSPQCIDGPWDRGGASYCPFDCCGCCDNPYPYPLPDWVQIQMERNQAILNQLTQNCPPYNNNNYGAESSFYASLPRTSNAPYEVSPASWTGSPYQPYDDDISDTESAASAEIVKEMSPTGDGVWSTYSEVGDSEYDLKARMMSQ